MWGAMLKCRYVMTRLLVVNRHFGGASPLSGDPPRYDRGAGTFLPWRKSASRAFIGFDYVLSNDILSIGSVDYFSCQEYPNKHYLR